MINELVFPKTPKLVSSEGNLAVFEISPLYPGYGTTIGNLLRRVLLSSIRGWGITRVQIENVLHEFSTLPGVLEDILYITLNIKQIRIAYPKEEGKLELKLEAKGKRDVKAGDIQGPGGLVIANPELHLATLTTDKSELKMILVAEQGYGYSQSDEREEPDVGPGVIILDTIFSPIKNVSFEVDDIKIGKRTDFNLLRLSIETDGTVTPTSALKEAIEIIQKHLQIIYETFA
jgi:DNA-directed RNA polymerase subunit alpha